MFVYQRDPGEVKCFSMAWGEKTDEPIPWNHLSLYNRAGFCALNLQSGQEYLRLDYHEDGRLIGSLCGVRFDDQFVSGYSAGFGGIDMVRDPEELARLPAMISAFCRHLSALGVRQMRIRCKPEGYSTNETMLHFVLLNAGFSILECSLNAHLPVDAYISPEMYIQKLASPPRRCLKHGLKENFVLRVAESLEEWSTGYAVLESNRAQKGRRLSLTLDYIMRLRQIFPKNIALFLLTHEESVIAAALVYDVTRRCSQVMYWGDAQHALSHSPMNVLAYRLVEQALGQGGRLLDLGATTPQGNPGVLRFKQSVAARVGLRFTLQHDLHG
ncbi:MAG: GNAT family N-acetyltransferase [Magnetococcales bacterium]|nr:GNAT family N-acetyltransferase [Magnetococcales bacterium]